MKVPSLLPPWSKPPRCSSPLSFFGLGVYRLFVLACLVLTMPSLSRANMEEGCAASYDPSADYFPDKATISHAEDFSVEYFGNYKLVKNERTSEQFALYQCGTPAPTGLPAAVKAFQVPLGRIALTSTIEISFVEMLGLRTKVLYVEGPQYFSSPCLQARVLSGDVKALSSNQTVRAAQMAEVDAVFTFSAQPGEPKAVSVSTAVDPGALHRAEWIVFMGLFFNAEARAHQVYKQIQDRYQCVSELAMEVPTSPKVAWVDYRFYQPNKWAISKAVYKLQYIRDLGATPVAFDEEDFGTAAEWQAKMADVDIVIDESYLGTLESFYTNFNLTSSSPLKFIRNGQIWRKDRLQSDLGALDWFEGAVASPDAVLQDLLTIVKPEAGFTHSRIWFRRAENDPIYVDDAAKCPDPTVAKVSPATECVPYSAATTPSPAARAFGLALGLALLARRALF